MTDTFRVGEIGVLVRDRSIEILTPLTAYLGQECTIVDPLNRKMCLSQSTGEVHLMLAYGVCFSDGSRWAVPPQCLRKKRPPPNWVKLCKLDELPVEETA